MDLQFFACTCPVLPGRFVEEAVCSSYVLGTFVKNQVDVPMWFLNWILLFFPLV
jgi:hypothetical protein